VKGETNMAGDIKAENYKKNVERLVKEWKQEMKPLIDQLDAVIGELKQLEVKHVAHAAQHKSTVPSSLGMRGGDEADKDQKRMDELAKKAADLRKKLEQSAMDFRKDLTALPAKVDVDQKVLEKLGSVVKELVEDGIPVGKYVKIPIGDLGFDFKKMKPTSASITFKIDF
jgi:hypothetical protein